MDQPRPPRIDPSKPNTSWHSTVADYMTQRIRHINAKSNEWYRIHRSGCGNGKGGGNWTYLMLIASIMAACWLAFKVFMWLVDVIQSIIQGICSCLIAAVPFVMVGIIGIAVVAWFSQSHRH